MDHLVRVGESPSDSPLGKGPDSTGVGMAIKLRAEARAGSVTLIQMTLHLLAIARQAFG
jgi:hypothetical protein